MKKISILFTLIILVASCKSPEKMFASGLKKINRAIERDSTLKLPNDTTFITDSIIEIDTVDNYITKTVTKTIRETINECNYDEYRVKSNRELRLTKNALKDSIRHTERMYKLETKRMEDSLRYLVKENRQLTRQIKSNNSKEKVVERNKTKREKGGWFTRFMGNYWWIPVIVAFLLGVYVRGLIKIPNFNFLKRN